MAKRLDQEYLTLMQPYDYGIALYKPPSTSTFHHGSVGYFDSLANWNPIADLSAALTTAWPAVYAPPSTDQLLEAPSETQNWGPKVGTETKGRKIDLKESVSLNALTAVPFELGSCFRFGTLASSAAVLLVNGPAEHRRYYHEAPFKNWVGANAKTILKERPEVKDYGLWVVTSTWSAAEAAINCWSGREKTVDVGFKLKAVEIGEIAPRGAWYHAGESEGWIGVKGSKEVGQKILFFGGLRFRWRPIVGLSQDKRPGKLRGHGDAEETIATFTTDDENENYELTCEGVLERESLRPMPPSQTEETQDEEGDEEDAVNW